MNILVTGGYGFIGSFVAERFFKENHSIFIIDNLSAGKKTNISFKHRSLICDIADEKCESFFKTHSIDVVIHCAAQTKVQYSIEKPLQDASTNILGLINMLNLSKKYNVKQFVFSSSAAVYGPNDSLPLKETDAGNPISPYGLNKMNGEIYCKKWEELYGLSSLIFRFSNVYGPKQHLSSESGVISIFTNRLIQGKSIIVHGDGSQTRDFIYAGDVAEAIYRGVISGISGTYNLSSNTQTSLNELIETLSVFHPADSIQYTPERSGDIRHSRLDNTNIKSVLDWVPMYSINEGLKKVIDYYQVEQPTEEKMTEEPPSSQPNRFLPYIENLFLFGIFFIFINLFAPIIDTVDLWLIYVLLASLLFGKAQSILASVLAIGVYMYDMTASGREWISLFADNNLLATFTIYLLVGLIVSYVVDRRKIELRFIKDELQSVQSKYFFLSDVYEETLDIKNQLQEQILKTEDGIGQIYQSTRSLDSLEPEALFSGAIEVLENTVRSGPFSIYVTAANGYARLAAKSNDPSFSPPASLKLEKGSLAQKAVETKKIVYNMNFNQNEPMFVSPIVHGSETTAIIVGHNVHFNQLTLSYQNLVDVVSRLISASFGRAQEYMNELSTKRYVGDTNALKPSYFQKILRQKEKAKDELNVPFTRLVIQTKNMKKEQLYEMSSILRTTDYYGFTDKKQLIAILSNTEPADAKLVIERLKQKGIIAAIFREDVPHAG